MILTDTLTGTLTALPHHLELTDNYLGYVSS